MNYEPVISPAPVNWLAAKVGVYTLLALTLLLVSLACLILAVTGHVRQLEAGFITWTSVFAVLTGWRLGRSRLKAWQALVAAVLVGGLWIGLVPGRLSIPVTSLLYESLALIYPTSLWITQETASKPDLALWLEAFGILVQHTNVLVTHLLNWANGTITGKGLSEPIVTALLWEAVLGATATWASWAIRRHRQSFVSLLPAGALLAIVLNYNSGNTFLLLTFLASLLLLTILTHHKSNEQNWEAARLDFSTESRLDLTLSAIPLVLVILVAAATAPFITLENINRILDNISNRQAEGSPDYSTGVTGERRPRGVQPGSGLPLSHDTREAPQYSGSIVMHIYTGELPPITPDLLSQPVPVHYWKALTFDTYTGKNWLRGDGEVVEYQSEVPARFAEEFEADGTWSLPSGYQLLNQRVNNLGKGDNKLYAAGSLVSVDQDYTVTWRSPRTDTTGEPGGGDIYGATTQALTYRVKSLEVQPGLEALQNAGTDYPTWVVSHYMALPDLIPSRVFSLSFDVTAGAATPYEKVKAIETYLRKFPYSLEVEAPPLDRDLADYFLFDLQEGFCDYYATAMVVMARAVGVPARMVLGYAPGDYDSFQGRYVVRDSDKHTWVEVYFSDIGWVPFEPTPAYPEVQYAGSTSTSLPVSVREVLEFNEPEQVSSQRNLILGVGALVLLAVLFGFSLFTLWMIRQPKEPLRRISGIYHRLQRSAQPLTSASPNPLRPCDTPNELKQALREVFAQIRDKKAEQILAFPAAAELHTLVELYNQAAFSPRQPGLLEEKASRRAWGRLGWRLWVLRLYVRIRKPS
jgi:transglutaminase-like putative cysteine protease